MKRTASFTSGPRPRAPAHAANESFPWLDFLEIDNDVIDREHREAVDQGNLLSRLIEERRDWPRLLAVLQQGRARSARHFATEDRILEQSGYPESASHCEEHCRILAAYDAILAELEAVAAPQPQHWQRAMAPRDLLVDHCLKDDLRFKSHLMHFGPKPR
jgi:hemerythrin-like metal-binding protein